LIGNQSSKSLPIANQIIADCQLPIADWSYLMASTRPQPAAALDNHDKWSIGNWQLTIGNDPSGRVQFAKSFK